MSNYKLIIEGEEIEINSNELSGLNMLQTSDNNFHVLQNNRGFNVELVHADFLKKQLTVNVNGNSYPMQILDAYDQRIQQMGLLSNTSQKINSIKAPMPGLIMDILVQEGQEIVAGFQLAILAAMKMENILVAPGEGTVRSIHVKKGDTVEKGQVIIEVD